MKFYKFDSLREISLEKERKEQNRTNAATVFLIFLLAGFLCWDSSRDPEIGNRKPVGTVISSVNRTERKLGSTVVWKKIIKDNSVYNYDTIRTEADSKTVIDLIDGTKVTLNEDTIIYINTNPEKLDINLIQGSMTVDTMNRKKTEVEKINIVHGNEVIKVDKSLISLGKKTSNSSLSLELKDGEALLRKADKEFILKKGNTVISKKDFIRELEIQSGSGDEKVLFQSFRESQSEQGRISGVRIVKSGNQIVVFGQDEKGIIRESRLSRDSSLGIEVSKPEVLQDKGKILQSALVSLGMNSWKAGGSDQADAVSLFPGNENNDTVIIFPSDGSVVDIAEMKSFRFVWKNPHRSRLFRISLFRKDDRKTVFEKLLDSESYSIDDFTLLKRGFYRFSVSSEDGTVQKEANFRIILKEIDSGAKFTSPDKIYVD